MKKREQIGPYTLLKPLGDGVHSNVWLADAGPGADKVALKLVRNGDAAARQRMLYEVELAIGFDHPNIVRVHECGAWRDITWMAMGYVAGPRGALTLANFRQLLLALVNVHANDIVHADIRNANLLLDEFGDLRLAGFSLARRKADLASAAPGLPQFMSPEQLRGQPIDTRTDIFAAGVVLYQVLTGKRPFEGTAFEVMQQILHDTQSAPSSVAPGLGVSFDDVVRRALARDKANRHGSAFELLADFDAACRRGVRVSA
jgi:serine/threonine protein kinase